MKRKAKANVKEMKNNKNNRKNSFPFHPVFIVFE